MLGRYPHQLSGGQQQRIVIAMALIAEPALLIMDEPTTGLDVTVEAAVLELVRELRQRHGTSVLFISHNLGTVVRVCDRIGVMYAGELVEEGSIRQVFKNPRHPYTRGLLDCLPSLDRDKRQAPLVPIPGQVAPPLARPVGCGFAARCAQVELGRCTSEVIPVLPLAGEAGHRVQCVRAAELPRWERKRSAARAPAARSAGAVAVRIDGLEKVYRQRRGLFGSGRAPVRALNGLDVIATKGETLAIVGESGCGKSTLAKVLAGLRDGELRPRLARGHRGGLDPRGITAARAQAHDPDGVPESRQHAQPEPQRRLCDRPGAPPPASPGRQRSGERGRAPPRRGQAAAGACSAASPTGSRGARSSAWPSRGRSPAIPT